MFRMHKARTSLPALSPSVFSNVISCLSSEAFTLFIMNFMVSVILGQMSPILSLLHFFIFSHILNYTNVYTLYKYLAICTINYVFSFMYLSLLNLNR